MKRCKCCGKTFSRRRGETHKEAAKRQFCSYQCAGRFQADNGISRGEVAAFARTAEGLAFVAALRARGHGEEMPE
jgi:transposase-like protein